MNKPRLLASLSGSKCLVMGILNVTPDSFSDGGRYIDIDTALDHAQQMLADGASIIDIGGESTRPGAMAVTIEEELQRTIPVIERLREHTDALISIDTSKPEVMEAAVNAGACLINDVRALQEPGALEMAAQLQVPVCLMHMQGQPRIMQRNPHYADVVAEVKSFLQQRIDACVEAGIAREHLIIDQGFGFGKNLEHNLALFRHIPEFVQMGLPLLVGVSRKSMIDKLLGRTVEERLPASLGMAALAAWMGAKIIRVHDVRETFDVVRMVEAIKHV
ncbi:MAG: dihydropteroate synthase [Thioalkalispiraceae bacterium]|jgi:dihydropteroate synthase